jgi:hypothetical protein
MRLLHCALFFLALSAAVPAFISVYVAHVRPPKAPTGPANSKPGLSARLLLAPGTLLALTRPLSLNPP